MTENLNTGEITIYGRGDDFQQVSLEYTPGDRVINVESGKVTEAPHSFDAQAQTQSAGRAEERGGFLGNQDTTPELMGTKSVDIKESGKFEAGEFAKGDPYDYENIGVAFDDLKGSVESWEKLVFKGEKAVETRNKIMEQFFKRQKKPIEPDMAEGGRVGFLHGGIVAKRRDPFYNGMGSLFKERV